MRGDPGVKLPEDLSKGTREDRKGLIWPGVVSEDKQGRLSQEGRQCPLRDAMGQERGRAHQPVPSCPRSQGPLYPPLLNGGTPRRTSEPDLQSQSLTFHPF